jgi:hypothetical protein
MTGYEPKGWGWFPAGQDNIWKVLELTDMSPGREGVRMNSLLPSAMVSPFVYSEGCAILS